MSQISAETNVRKLSLEETHRRLGAQWLERAGWLVPASYGDALDEYTCVRERGAGLIDLSTRGRINVSGTEAVMFLNGLVTNDVKALAEGSWMHAAFPNVQGRLLAFVRVLHRPTDGFLFDTEAATRETVTKTLARFTLAGDFHVTDMTEETVELSVQGARSGEIISGVLGAESGTLARGRVLDVEWEGQRITVLRATHTAEDGFDLIMDAGAASSLWDALHQAGATPFGYDALEMLRVEAGQPSYGADVGETNVVLEAGMDEAVSYTKGCYIGQEIIARIHWRGHVAKRLAGISLDEEDAVVRPDDKLRASDGKEVGRITSAVFSPRLKCHVALALVKYDYLAPGTPVTVLSEAGEHRAHVASLPLVRGSWFGPEESAADAAEVKPA